MQDQQVTIPKEVLAHLVSDIEHLIDDIEAMLDPETMKIVDKRLEDVKKGRIKAFSEEDFHTLLQKDGLDAH